MELDLQYLFRLLCTAVLIGWGPATPPPPTHPPPVGVTYLRGRYWSAQIDDSFCNPLLGIIGMRLVQSSAPYSHLGEFFSQLRVRTVVIRQYMLYTYYTGVALYQTSPTNPLSTWPNIFYPSQDSSGSVPDLWHLNTDIDPWIRKLDSGSCSFCQWLSRCQ